MYAGLVRIGAALLPLLLLIVPFHRLHADEALLTLGDMLRLRELPLESTRRTLSEEERVLYRNYEFYAYTAFEALQVANNAAELISAAPLFCAPQHTFRFDQDGDIARLADHVTAELAAELGQALEDYDDQPASLALLLGLRAAFPCRDDPKVARR